MSGAAGRPRPQRMRVGVPAVLALGSNLGEREATIRSAIDELDAVDGIRVDARSRLVETDAITLDGVDQNAPRYLNAVVLVHTTLTPHALLDAAHVVEDAHGRVRERRWGDRTLDIDVIDFDGRVLEDATLTLPHPRAAERAFVLAPWLQVDPDAVVAGVGPVAELLPRASDVVHEYSSSSSTHCCDDGPRSVAGGEYPLSGGENGVR